LAGVAGATLTMSSATVYVAVTPVGAITAIPASAGVGDAVSSDSVVGEQVRELKQASGLTWAQFAGLLGVTPRAVHFWVEGGRISADHLARLDRVRHAINEIAAAEPTATRAALFTVGADGRTPFARLIAEIHRGGEWEPSDRRPLGTLEAPSGIGAPGRPVATEDFVAISLPSR
jgi:transcriptional regulator with XRE-family HTH domain